MKICQLLKINRTDLRHVKEFTHEDPARIIGGDMDCEELLDATFSQRFGCTGILGSICEGEHKERVWRCGVSPGPLGVYTIDTHLSKGLNRTLSMDSWTLVLAQEENYR